MHTQQSIDFIIDDYRLKFQLLGMEEKQTLQAFTAASTLTNARLLKHLESQSEQTRQQLKLFMVELGEPTSLDAFKSSETAVSTLKDDEGHLIVDLFVQFFTENLHKLFLQLETARDEFISLQTDKQKNA